MTRPHLNHQGHKTARDILAGPHIATLKYDERGQPYVIVTPLTIAPTFFYSEDGFVATDGAYVGVAQAGHSTTNRGRAA